jgi:hypothetical protein
MTNSSIRPFFFYWILLGSVLAGAAPARALDPAAVNWQTIRSRVAWLNSMEGNGSFTLSVDGVPALAGVAAGGHYSATKFPPGSFTAKIEGTGVTKPQGDFPLTVPDEGGVLLVTVSGTDGHIHPLTLDNKKTAGQFVFVNATANRAVQLIRREGPPLTILPGTVTTLRAKDLAGFLSLEIADPATGRKQKHTLPGPDHPVVTVAHLSGIAEDFCDVTRFRSEDFTVVPKPDAPGEGND